MFGGFHFKKLVALFDCCVCLASRYAIDLARPRQGDVVRYSADILLFGVMHGEKNIVVRGTSGDVRTYTIHVTCCDHAPSAHTVYVSVLAVALAVYEHVFKTLSDLRYIVVDTHYSIICDFL